MGCFCEMVYCFSTQDDGVEAFVFERSMMFQSGEIGLDRGIASAKNIA